MSKNAYIIHNPIKEENILGALMNIPYWLEEIKNCVHSENVDISFLTDFLKFYANDWNDLTKEVLRKFFLGFVGLHKRSIRLIGKIAEGEYSFAGANFASILMGKFEIIFDKYYNFLGPQYWKIYDDINDSYYKALVPRAWENYQVTKKLAC